MKFEEKEMFTENRDDLEENDDEPEGLDEGQERNEIDAWFSHEGETLFIHGFWLAWAHLSRLEI